MQPVQIRNDVMVEGSSQAFKRSFLDEFGDPLYPNLSGPVVTVFDIDDSIIFQGVSQPTTVPGEWEISVPIPNLDLVDDVDLKIEWAFIDSDFNNYKVVDSLTVQPSSQNRVSDIVKLWKTTDTSIECTVPIQFRSGDTLEVSIHLNNAPIIEGVLLDPNTLKITKNFVHVRIPLTVAPKSIRLEPVSVTFTHTDSRRPVPRYITQNLWIITPQIGVAISMLNQFVDKAKLENIIPALEYTSGDLTLYLYRGLQMFNSYGGMITSFNGSNMQGVLLHAWVVCASYAALTSQLLAEGANAFDFAGQSVNLNVDRTPSIEAALGRLEQQIENEVKPLKKQLTAAGINGGDGSVGAGSIRRGPNFGRVYIINAPTSKLGRGPGSWLRSPLRTVGRS